MWKGAELWLSPCLLPWKMGCSRRSGGVPAPGCRVRAVRGSASRSYWIFLEEEPRAALLLPRRTHVHF